jgi:hypothetical protein
VKLLIALLLLCSCNRNTLSVFTEYVSIESLPSYQLNTPDPRLYCPDFGEKIHITWSLPKDNPYCALFLRIDLRYGNGTFDTQTVELFTPEGIYVLPLMNEEYRCKEGIFTYKITLFGDDCPIATRTHLLWAEPIQLSPDN